MKLQQLIERIALDRKEEFPFPDDLESYLDDFIPNTLLKSETLQQAFGVSAYQMEEVYAESYTFYLDERYLDASTGFRMLVLLNPFVFKYWMGLGASLQMLEKDEKALHAYAVSSLLESDNPFPHYHAFECYRRQNNETEALKALELAYRRCQNRKYQGLREKIEAAKKKEAACL